MNKNINILFNIWPPSPSATCNKRLNNSQASEEVTIGTPVEYFASLHTFAASCRC